MTRTEKRFIERAIKRAAHRLEGAPPDVIEKIMRDEIEAAIDYAAADDSGDIGSEVSESPYAGGMPQPPSLIRMPDADPQTQPRTEMVPPETPQKSLLILPGQEGFESVKAGKPTVGIAEPLQVWKEPPAGKKFKQGAFQERWQLAISTLVELVTDKMPPDIEITPVGAAGTIHIERLNVLADVVAGNVKISYGLKGQTGSTPSQRNEGGESMEPMRIDLVVNSAFNIKDKTVNWAQRVADVVAQSEQVFRPRSREIANHTPAKTGSVEMLLSGGMEKNAGGFVDFDRSGQIRVVDSARNPAEKRKANKVYLPSL